MIVDWDEAKAYLEQRLKQARVKSDDFEGSEFQRGKLSGEITTLNAMLNLPEAIKLLKQHDKDVARNAR